MVPNHLYLGEWLYIKNKSTNFSIKYGWSYLCCTPLWWLYYPSATAGPVGMTLPGFELSSLCLTFPLWTSHTWAASSCHLLGRDREVSSPDNQQQQWSVNRRVNFALMAQQRRGQMCSNCQKSDLFLIVFLIICLTEFLNKYESEEQALAHSYPSL